MAFEELINEELKYSRYEYQVKFKTSIQESDLIKFGARKLGVVLHEDRYFIPRSDSIKNTDELIRIRREGEEDILFTYKGPVANLKMRNRLIVDKQISEDQVADITKNYQEIISINKKRSIFILNKVRILLDKVDYLGAFVEFDVEKEEDYGLLDPIFQALHLDSNDAIKLSYLELALISSSPVKRTLFGLYYKLEKIAFGMSSAIMTVMGMIVGLASAHQSATAIIGGIASVGLADSMADSLSVYTAKKSERGSSEKVAFRNALATFWSKLFFSMSFLVIFMVLPTGYAMIFSIVWGFSLLAFINFLISYVQGESVVWGIFKNISLAIFIVLVSFFVGNLIARS